MRPVRQIKYIMNETTPRMDKFSKPLKPRLIKQSRDKLTNYTGTMKNKTLAEKERQGQSIPTLQIRRSTHCTAEA